MHLKISISPEVQVCLSSILENNAFRPRMPIYLHLLFKKDVNLFFFFNGSALKYLFLLS